jgi:hypothetical protein
MFGSLLVLLALHAPADVNDGLHSAILSPGDLDGDGRADVVAAERRPAKTLGGTGSGGSRVYALSGADGSLLWSRAQTGVLGSVLADAGDLDGDGVHEVAVAGSETFGRAPVLVLSGATGKVVLRVPALDGVVGMGRSLAAGRDATCDGIPDLLVGARDQALIVDGATGLAVASVGLVEREIKHPDGGRSTGTVPRIRPTLRGADGVLRAQRPAANTFLGSGVAWLPDVDGDGRAEVAIGSCELFPIPMGRTYVVPSADPGRSLTLPSAGWCLLALEDVDGDGSPELAASTPAVDLGVFQLDDGKRVWRLGFDCSANSEGGSLDALPDLDGDGAPELLLGAGETGEDCDIDFAAIHSGRTGASLRPPLEPALWDARCRSGLDAAGLPDLDGDGAPEVAVHVARLNEVRVVSARDWSLRWIVALDQLPARELGAEEGR